MLDLIKKQCAELNRMRGLMRQIHEAKMKTIARITEKPDKELRELQFDCAALRNQILENVESARREFVKPKTHDFGGITVGFEKTRDSIIMPDEKILIKRIEELLPAKQGETVLDRSVALIKVAFKKLPAADLQKLGCQIVSGADKPVVRANDDDIETLVHKSLGDATETKGKNK